MVHDNVFWAPRAVDSSIMLNSVCAVCVWCECVFYNQSSLQLSAFIHNDCRQIQTEHRETAPLGPSALPPGSGSPDRRLCRDPCPPATELHLPRFPSQARMKTALLPERAREENWLNANTLALSGPHHLQPLFLWQQEKRGQGGFLVRKKPALPHA